jgi:uncharacterized protein
VKSLRIPMRDGVHLSAILYSPEDCRERRPVIFAMTPYIAQSHHEWGVDFSNHGYVFVNVDVRGRGNSDGEFDPRNESCDGYDIVEWLARQPYCNGQVAMYGASYLGYCQWAAASKLPPHLMTIVPTAPAFFGVDFPARKNVFLSYAVQWLLLVAGRTSQGTMFADAAFWRQRFKDWLESGRPFNELDIAVTGFSSGMFQEWLSHPDRGEYWDSYNPTPQEYACLSIPILTITGAYDADQLGALEHYRQHLRNASPEASTRHYLVIGPWDHSGCSAPRAEFGGLSLGSASTLDLRALHRQWYAWTLQAGPKPEFLRKHVAYYVIGAEQWRYADTLEAITTHSSPLYLHSSGNPTDIFGAGSLAPEPRDGYGPDQFVYDPADVSLAALESSVDPANLLDQRLVNARVGGQLVYHSAPFAEDAEISGFFELSAWLAIDQPDTDIRAVIYEVAVDGTAVQLTRDWIRARYRQSDRAAQLIRTHQPLHYRFMSFMFVSRRIAKGNRLRLVVGPIASMYWQKNYNSGGAVSDESMEDARAVTVKLFHDSDRPSALYVPYGQATQRDE